jgi:adenine deaminase
MIALLLMLAAQPAPGRTYHPVTIERLQRPAPTHVMTEGTVVYRRKMKDGDWHVTIVDAQDRKVVVEIIPAIPLKVPTKGQRVRVWGISRADFQHKWPELHPAERIEVLR